MTLALESTSIPAWAVVPSRPDADLSGRYWTVIAFADTDVADWLAQIEITVARTDIAHRDVHCAHCRTVTRAAVEPWRLRTAAVLAELPHDLAEYEGIAPCRHRVVAWLHTQGGT
jgi:hypothetical protein